MANVTLNSIVLSPRYKDELRDVINQSCAFLRGAKKVVTSGPNIAFVIGTDGYSGASTGDFGEGATFSTFSSDSDLSAVLQWARYGDGKFVSGTALRAVLGSPNPSAQGDLFMRKLKASVRTVCAGINQRCLTGSGATNIATGLSIAISDTTNYATIDRTQAVNMPARSLIVDPGSNHAPTLQEIRADITAISLQCGYPPDVLMLSPANRDYVAGLFDQNRQYVVQTSADGAKQNLIYAAQDVMIDSTRILAERQMVDTEGWYFHSGDVEVVFAASKEMSDRDGIIAGEDNLGELGIPLMVKLLPDDSDGFKFEVFAEYGVRLLQPNAAGKRLHWSRS